MTDTGGRKFLSEKLTPPRVLIMGFIVIILVGTILLSFPFSSRNAEFTPLSDTLFTATSAACVTGLVVRDTGTYWSSIGQTIILCLIQIGGIGFMTLAGFLRLVVIHGDSNRGAILQGLNVDYTRDIRTMLKYVISVTFGCEALGAFFLFLRYIFQMRFSEALGKAVFHSVSAFCNAGFDINGNYESLTAYCGDVYVNLVVSMLIIMGGLGYVVWIELLSNRNGRIISVYARVVIITSVILIVLGTVSFAVLEWNNPKTIGMLPAGEKLLASFFQSVTLRTAGFNTVSLEGIGRVTVVVSCILMFIGGSSGSTAGGIKTGTFALVFCTVLNVLKGKRNLVIFNRRIHRDNILRAFAVASTGVSIMIISIIMLSFTENVPISYIIFECFSAFATVGVSMGLTAVLTPFGRGVIIILMFLGRIGVLTLSCALASKLKRRGDSVDYLETNIYIG